MTEEHWSALLKVAETKPDDSGWACPPDGRHLTLHVAREGATLTVGRVESLRQEADLVYARTSRGDTYVVALADIFAGAIDGTTKTDRKAGFR